MRWLYFTVLFVLLASWLPVLLLRWLEPPVTAFMLEQRSFNGDTYHDQWNDRPALGSAAPLAVMAAEDQKFPDYHGFDVTAIQGAFFAYTQPVRNGGAVSHSLAALHATGVPV